MSPKDHSRIMQHVLVYLQVEINGQIHCPGVQNFNDEFPMWTRNGTISWPKTRPNLHVYQFVWAKEIWFHPSPPMIRHDKRIGNTGPGEQNGT